MKRQIVLLTKSAKDKGYCVAGIDCETKKWVRLVTSENGNTGALSKADISYFSNGQEWQFVPLDMVEVDTSDYFTKNSQTENCLLKGKISKPLRRYSINDFICFYSAQSPAYIYCNTREYLIKEEVRNIRYSLLFVKVQNLLIESNGNKIKARFYYNNNFYNNFSVTDKKVYSEILDTQEDKFYEESYIVVSLPALPWSDTGEDRYYKFIAQIFEI